MMKRLRNWRVGATSGLNATDNNLKMTGAVVLPLLVALMLNLLFVPTEWYNLGMTFSMAGWLVWAVMLYAWAKGDAGNYIVFPQSKWRFPEGASRTFDLKMIADSWEELESFKDGGVGYRVHFLDKFLYDDLSLPTPRMFDSAYWLLPEKWDISFHRRALGEFFHKGLFVTKPDCEDISVYVVDWVKRGGQDVPVGMINDCAFRYHDTLKNNSVENLAKLDSLCALHAAYSDKEKIVQKLTQTESYLKEELDVAQKDSSTDFKKAADNRMKSVRKRHGRIMDVKEPLLTRIINLQNLVIFGMIALVAYLIGHFFLGAW